MLVEDNGRKLASTGILAQLKTLMESTQHEGIICESARVFVQLSLTKNGPSQLSPFSYHDVEKIIFFLFIAELLEEVIKARGLEALKPLLESKHDILKMEALNAYTVFYPTHKHHEALLHAMGDGLATILEEGENEELKTRALATAKQLVHKDSYATAFEGSKLFHAVEGLSTKEGPHQQAAREILAAKE